MAVTNVLISGVGGQGAILASELLALAAMAAGQDVKQGEFHGVAQRGGSVFSPVRLGDRVYSPVAPRGAVAAPISLSAGARSRIWAKRSFDWAGRSFRSISARL